MPPEYRTILRSKALESFDSNDKRKLLEIDGVRDFDILENQKGDRLGILCVEAEVEKASDAIVKAREIISDCGYGVESETFRVIGEQDSE